MEAGRLAKTQEMGTVCRLETGGDGDACRCRCLIPASGSRVAQDGFALCVPFSRDIGS